MFAEERLHGSGRAILGGVNFLNEPVNVGSHDEEVSRGYGGRIPISVRSATRNEDSRSSAGFDVLVADTHD